jgi:cell fate regulator YaaT (PSP1 superfamily)
MPMMMAVSFERRGRLHYLDPGPHRPAVGDKVLVPTDTGPEIAECIWAPQRIEDDVGGLPVCAGIATQDDLERDGSSRTRKADARVAARRLVREYELPMTIVAVDYIARAEQVIIYFSAPHRVDFRTLVRDRASVHQGGQGSGSSR